MSGLERKKRAKAKPSEAKWPCEAFHASAEPVAQAFRMM
jgi:hypothetical protein